MRAIAKADLIVTTPEKWDGVSRSWQTRSYVKAVSLIVIDEIHLLGRWYFLVFNQNLCVYLITEKVITSSTGIYTPRKTKF